MTGLLIKNSTYTESYHANVISPHDAAKVVAYISLVCGFIAVLSMIVCRKWRARLFSAKLLLMIKCIFELITYTVSLAFYNSDDDPMSCRIQTTFIQFFSVGANIYLACLMIETNILIKQVIRTTRPKDIINKNMFIRHAIYHFIVFSFGIPVVIWINVRNDYHYGGAWCYVKTPFYVLLFAMIPLWLVIITIIICDVSTVAVLHRLLSRRFPNDTPSLTRRGSSVRPLPLLQANDPPPELTSLHQLELFDKGQGSDKGQGQPRPQDGQLKDTSNKSNTLSTSLQPPPSPTTSLLSHKSYSVYLRLIIIPIIFILMWIPTSVRTIIYMNPSLGSPMVNRIFSYAGAICGPSGGFWNAVIWVFTDKEAIREWNMFFDKILNSQQPSTSF